MQEQYILPEENDCAGNELGFYFGWRRATNPAHKQSVEEFLGSLYRSPDAGLRCALDNIDPALLWFLNTAGCRWWAGVCALGDSAWISGAGIPAPPNVGELSNCCNNCYFVSRRAWHWLSSCIMMVVREAGKVLWVSVTRGV